MSLFARKPQQVRIRAGVHGSIGDTTDRIAGQVDPAQPRIGPQGVVNPYEDLPTGWGPDNDQQFQSGHTNNVVTNESAEQGWGVGPERAWAHYPHVEQLNPFRALNAFQRNGEDGYSDLIYRPAVVAFWQQALEAENAAAATRHVGRRGVVNQAPSAPYVTTIPPIMPGGY